MSLTVIILTYNEGLHIRRVIMNAQLVADEVIIVDSYSTDDTVNIARELGANVYKNPFVSHAAQFQWALHNTGIKTTWVMRLDADEYLTPELVQELQKKIPGIGEEVSGIILKRQVHFMGKWIRHGGYYPVRLMRIWRYGHAKIEQRWMDEHIYLTEGKAIDFQHDFVDDNLNSLTWWIAKHNDYATREAIDVLNARYGFLNETGAGKEHVHEQAARKRWYKNNLYLRLPLFLRSLLYFKYRYFLKLGFLDGHRGLVWHFLQGFWYRFLVDAKIMQIEWWAREENMSIREVITIKYRYKL